MSSSASDETARGVGFTLREVATIYEALKIWRVFQEFNARAVGATEEERQVAFAELAVIDRLLSKRFGNSGRG